MNVHDCRVIGNAWQNRVLINDQGEGIFVPIRSRCNWGSLARGNQSLNEKFSIVSLGSRLLSPPNVSSLLPIRWNVLNTILVAELVVLSFCSLYWPLCSIRRRCGPRALKTPNPKDPTHLSTRHVVSPCVTGWSLLVRWIWSISFCRLSFPSLPSSPWIHWSFTNQANMIVS